MSSGLQKILSPLNALKHFAAKYSFMTPHLCCYVCSTLLKNSLRTYKALKVGMGSRRLWQHQRVCQGNSACTFNVTSNHFYHVFKSPFSNLPPFSLIRDFEKQNTRGNVSKISVNLTCYRHVGSKSTNHSPLAWRRGSQKVTLVAVIGGFRSDLSTTRKADGNFGNVSAGVLFFKVAYQRKRW